MASCRPSFSPVQTNICFFISPTHAFICRLFINGIFLELICINDLFQSISFTCYLLMTLSSIYSRAYICVGINHPPTLLQQSLDRFSGQADNGLLTVHRLHSVGFHQLKRQFMCLGNIPTASITCSLDISIEFAYLNTNSVFKQTTRGT